MLKLTLKQSGNPGGNVTGKGSRSLLASIHQHPTRWLLLILSTYISLAVLVCFLNPLFEPTDEIRHYRFIRILVTEKRLPVQGEEPLRAQSHHPPLYYTLAALASAWVPTSHTGLFDQPRNPHWGIRNWEVGVDNKLQYWHAAAEVFNLENLAVYVPRLLNIYLGALTISLTYIISVRLWAEHPELALLPAAIVAFNPQYIYLSAAINNDILAGLSGTAVLYACLVILLDGVKTRSSWVLGLLLGIAVLSKIHLAVLAPVVVLTIILSLLSQSDRPGRTRLRTGIRMLVILFLVTGLVTGWWFARNVYLYGDLTGMNRLNELWGGRPVQGGWWALQQGLPYLWSSLWGRFGYGQIPLPSPYTAFLAAACCIGLLGLLVKAHLRLPSQVLLVFISAVVLFLCVVSYYIIIQPAGAMGRFVFPVFPVFAVLVTAGWTGWVRKPGNLVSAGVGMMLMLALSALVIYWYPAVSYPRSSQKEILPPAYQLGEAAQISQVTVSPDVIYPGEAIFVIVTWYPLQITTEPFTVYVHLIDDIGAVIAQRDTYPGLGRAPTTSWRVGDPFIDIYRVDVPESTYSPNHAHVVIGMYTASSRLPLFDLPSGIELPEGLVVQSIDLLAKAGVTPNPLQVNFDDQIKLVGYTISPRNLHAGETLELTLYWEPQKDVSADIDVFAQVLDNDWQVWGSRDGGHPDWNSDEVIVEKRVITLLPSTPPGTYPVQVGLYTQDGRLPIIAMDGTHLDNRYLLGPIRVE